MDRRAVGAIRHGSCAFFQIGVEQLADAIRHDALLNRRRDDGTPERDHWDALAARGDRTAIARLVRPAVPEAFEYLQTWLAELHGRSGVGMAGLAPLTWTTIRHWREETGALVHPDEARALMRLDAILLHPDPDVR